jgi:hypothetical protein
LPETNRRHENRKYCQETSGVADYAVSMKSSLAQAPIAKLDLYEINKADYATPRTPVLLRIAQATYLGIAGRGTPGGEAFQQAIGALYSVAFTIKMASKFAGRDYGVSKLEGLWWVDSGHTFMTEPKDRWSWRLLIRTPDFIGKRELEAARKKLAEKGKEPLFKEVELTALNEDQCVQMLHTGPYDREAETVRQMETFAAAQGYRFDGLHHEIYLSDPRRVAPEKLQTILRIPVRQVS